VTGKGHVLSNRYEYAAGYLAQGVEIGRGDRDTFRREALSRFLDHAQASVTAVA
jgi:hypothetical protein